MANAASSSQAPIAKQPPGVLEVGDDADERQGLPQYPVGLDSRASDIKRLLVGKAVIGIWGVGGVGKTTVAKKVFSELFNQFEYTCFAENVKGKQNGYFESWLLCQFHKSRPGLDGTPTQWSGLKGAKTMIVLDDVDSENQLSVLPTLDHFGKGSCILLTSRDIDTFKFYDDHELYQLNFLNDEEAKKLFCQHAFGAPDIPSYLNETKHLKEQAEAVMKKCNGLPLTLEVMGRCLRNQMDAEVWKETIDKLERAESINEKNKDRVWPTLSVSYETLAKEEQDMFIEAGTYFLGQPLDQALAAWSSISAHPQSRWENLVNRSMVKEDQYKTVWVHEHLRDLSWSLAKGDILLGSYEKATELVDQLNAKHVNATTKILKLDSPDLDQTLQLQCVADLTDLKYLDLDWVQSKGSGKNLPRAVSLLRWNLRGEPNTQFPISLIPMTSLTFLELGNWDVPKGFPEALGNLTNLRHLSLISLRGLDHLPDNFDNLSNLNYLNLEDLSLPSLPKSFGNLSALEHLQLWDLNISELPESFGNLSSLIKLRVCNCEKLASLSSSFSHHLALLKELEISTCPLLKCLPDSLSRLSSLQQLNLAHCSALKELGDSFGTLCALEDLNLSGTGVERLPHSFSQLSKLQRLSLCFCKSLKELGDSFGNLSALKYLDLDKYTCIARLPENFGRLSSLEELKCEFDEARLLPENFCLLTALRDLSIKSASLERLPESLGELFRLEKLSLEINNVNALPMSLGKLASLRKLYIHSEKLEKLPDIFVKLSSLQELTVRARTSVGILSSIGPLSSLRSLDVREIKKPGDHKVDCDISVEEHADSFGKLCSLENLEFQQRSLGSLPTTVGELCSLRNMDVDCGNLKELPESLGMLSSLETLKIVARKLENLPHSIGRLRSLRTMEIEVSRIRSIPESINQLSSLRMFSFNCDGNDRMPDHFDRLPFPSLSLVLKGSASVPTGIRSLRFLQDLTLKFHNVKSLPEELGELSSLQALDISCRKLESLPESLVRLSSLRVLRLDLCRKLNGLPDSLGSLSFLRELHLRHCFSLKSLPDSLGRSSPSQGELTHGTTTSEGEPSLPTTAAEANALELTVSVFDCPGLEALTMRRLGWVPDKEEAFRGWMHYRR